LTLFTAYLVARFALARLGGINGDVLGAMIALGELGGLVGYVLWQTLSG